MRSNDKGAFFVNGQKRILMIFLQLLRGRKITKRELMATFDKKESTIQRDMAIIDEVLLEEIEGKTMRETVFVARDGKGNYQLKDYGNLFDLEKLSDEELLVLLKILYGSRVFNAHELKQMHEKLLSMAQQPEILQNFLRNEEFYYEGVAKNDLLDQIQLICEAIQENRLVEFTYTKNGVTKTLKRLPEAIHFSDMYFYMISDNHYGKDNANLTEMNKFRINNMENLQKLAEYLPHKAYKERYEGGVLRNQTGKFSYFGQPITMVVEFYFDPVYVLDRFPNSKIIRQEGNVHTIEMQVNDGYGMKMWLLSQGDMIKVLSPASMRDYTVNEMIGALESYGFEVYKDGEQKHVQDLDSN